MKLPKFDPTDEENEDVVAFAVLIVGTILWIIVLTIIYEWTS